MNIALFASAFWPSLGGVEELVRQLAHQQWKRGDRTMILTNRWPKDLPKFEEYEGIPVRRYHFRVPEQNWKQRTGALLFGPGTLKEVCWHVGEAEVLHVQCVSSNAYYALQAKRRTGLPLVVTLQGELTMDATGLFQHSRFAQDLMRSALEQADAITACSADTLAEAEPFYGAPFGARGRVIYNGILLDDFRKAIPFPHARPYILGIGRHVPQKGFDVLLRAFGQMVQKGETAHDLLLAGDGPEHEALKKLAAELGVSERTVFTGRVDRPEAVRLFTGCSFFVLPSRHEPMGIVNLEAMAAGKAVIASRVGGVPELVQDGATGLLVPGDDVEALSAALTRLTSHTDLRRELGDAGRERALIFDWPAIAEEYAQLYASVIMKKAVPTA